MNKRREKMKENKLVDLSFHFAKDVISLVRELKEKKKLLFQTK